MIDVGSYVLQNNPKGAKNAIGRLRCFKHLISMCLLHNIDVTDDLNGLAVCTAGAGEA